MTAVDNAQRSNRFEAAMMSLHEEYGDDPQAVLIDLLADARHWCDAHGESFAELDRLAYRHYLAEVHQPTNERN
jgi:hypothetical protein